MLQTQRALHYLESELESQMRDTPGLDALLASGAVDGLWLWDMAKPDEVWTSLEFWELLGYASEQMPHRQSSWLDTLIEEDHASTPFSMGKRLENSAERYDQLLRFRNAEGETVYVRARGARITDPSGRHARIFGTFCDMTPMLRMTELAKIAELDDVLQERTRKNDDLNHLIYSMSHDMLSPLHTASAAMREIKYELAANNPDEAEVLVEMCNTSISRMITMLKDLRAYFTAAEPLDTPGSTIWVTDLATQVQADLAAMIERHNATVHVLCEHAVVGEPAQIRSLLQNLVENAVKFGSLNGPAEVTIMTEALPEQGQIRISVIDNGLGVDPTNSTEIFSPFKRLHRRGREGGAGLGLAICKKIAANHGAQIGTTNLPGGGCQFYLDIQGRS